jgi:hypothetical protein
VSGRPVGKSGVVKQPDCPANRFVAANGISGTGCVRQTRHCWYPRATKAKRSRRILTPELEQRILDMTLKTRPADATHWSVRVLASKLRVSRMMVQRLWQRHDIQPHRVEKFKISNDPKFEDKVRDVSAFISTCLTAPSCSVSTKRASFRH